MILGKRLREPGEFTSRAVISSERKCRHGESCDGEDETILPDTHRTHFLLVTPVDQNTKEKIHKNLEAFSLVRRDNPNNSGLLLKVLMKEAELLMKINEFPLALEKFQEILAVNPQDVEALSQSSLCYAYLGRFEDAQREINKALDKDPEHLCSLLNLVAIYSDGFGHIKIAGDLIKQIARAHPANERVIAYSKLLGVQLRDPDDPVPYKISSETLYFVALRQMASSSWSQAKETLTRIISTDSQHSPSLCWRGNIYKNEGLLSEAKEDFLACLIIEPNNKNALFGMAHCEFVERAYESSLEFLDRLMSLQPVSVNVLFLRGEVFRKLSRFSEALEHFEKVKQFFYEFSGGNPGSLSSKNKNAFVRAMSRLGIARYRSKGGPKASQEDIDLSLKDIEIALAYSPGDPFVCNTIAGIFLDLQQYEKANSCLEESISRHPDDIDTLITIGRVYRAQKLLDEAERAFKRAIELKSDAMFAHYHLVGVYLDGKQYLPALDTINKIQSLREDESLPLVKQVIEKMLGRTNQNRIHKIEIKNLT